MSSYRRMKFDPMDIKVIILYILYHAGIPLSATEITDIILADSLMDFFEAHMYITMLIKDGQIEHIMSEDKYALELESMDDIEKNPEDKGSRGHPGSLTHKKAAEKIYDFIKTL